MIAAAAGDPHVVSQTAMRDRVRLHDRLALSAKLEGAVMQLVMRRFLIPALCATLLAFAAAWLQAQPAQKESEPNVISGSDLGFRIEGYRGGKPVGTLVVRVKGEWREAQFSVRPQVVTP